MPLTCLQNELKQRAEAGLLRQRRVLESMQGTRVVVDGQPYLSFCSNDYLGLAQHPQMLHALQQGVQIYGVGSGASHLVSGHFAAHEQLEQRLAAFVGMPRALLFTTGYMANLGAIQALVGRSDTVLADRLNHASLNDAMLLSRAQVKRYRHNDVAQLEQLLATSTGGRKLVISDAVFSMDGDIAPLPEILALCERFDAWLLVDDAHGFGVLGPDGRGTLAQFGLSSPRIIYMATLGKAAGVSGAFVAGEAPVIDTLIQNARSYIYTTASAPALSLAVLQGLKLIQEEQFRRTHLQQHILQLRTALADLPWPLQTSNTPIQPLIIGDNAGALALSEALRDRGIWVPAIRPPTVPQGTARLRISLSAAHVAEDIQQLADALHELAH